MDQVLFYKLVNNTIEAIGLYHILKDYCDNNK